MRDLVIFQCFERGIRLLPIALLLLFAGGCSEPEEPEYVKHDWFAYYTVDDTENIITKDGFDNQYPIVIDAFEGYGFSILPDSSENVLYVSLESGFTDFGESTGTTTSFSVAFVIRDQDILALKSQNEELRLEKLTAFFKNRTFANIPGNRDTDDYISLTLIDKNGNAYENEVFNNGTYSVILDYIVKVEKVTTVSSPSHGPVLKVLLDIESDLEDVARSGEYTVSAKTQLYIRLPFSE